MSKHPVTRHQYGQKGIPILLATALLSACGGGGGGGTAASPTVNGVTASTQPQVVTAADGSARSIQSNCPITQKLITTAVGDNLRINDIQWLQTVQLDAAATATRLVANKDVKVRIDVLSDTVRAIPNQLVLRVYDPATNGCTSILLTTPTQVPTSIDQTSLSTAFVATIPANLVKSGMNATLQIDDNTGRTATEANQTYRYVQPQVVSIAPQVIKIIPITVAGFTGHFTSTADMTALIKRLYPVSDVTVIMQPPVSLLSLALTNLTSLLSQLVGTLGIMNNALSELDDVCNTLNGPQASALASPKCVGLFPDNLLFKPASGSGQITGLAYVGGTTLIANSVSSIENLSTSDPYQGTWIAQSAMTVAHEVGHIFSLNHGNCGGPTGLDSRLYPDGRLDGSAGYDAVRNIYFSSTKMNSSGAPIFSDVMSYCNVPWTSDRGYKVALSYLSGGAADVTTAANIVTTTSEARVTSTAPESPSISTPAKQWVKITLTPKGWLVRHSSFAPSTLKSSELSLQVISQNGTETLPLLSTVISAGDGVTNYGPYYIDLADRKLAGLKILSNGMEMAQLPLTEL